jgi:hypothetical protein
VKPRCFSRALQIVLPEKGRIGSVIVFFPFSDKSSSQQRRFAGPIGFARLILNAFAASLKAGGGGRGRPKISSSPGKPHASLKKAGPLSWTGHEAWCVGSSFLPSRRLLSTARSFGILSLGRRALSRRQSFSRPLFF